MMGNMSMTYIEVNAHSHHLDLDHPWFYWYLPDGGLAPRETLKRANFLGLNANFGLVGVEALDHRLKIFAAIRSFEVIDAFVGHNSLQADDAAAFGVFGLDIDIDASA